MWGESLRSCARGHGAQFLEHGTAIYAVGIVLAVAVGALVGAAAWAAWRRRARNRRGALLPVAGLALIFGVAFAWMVDAFGAARLREATSSEPPALATPELLEAARLACVSPRHRSAARKALARQLESAICRGTPEQSQAALAELVRLASLACSNSPFTRIATERGWGAVLVRTRLCRPAIQWMVHFTHGDFAEAAQQFEGPLWDPHRWRRVWLLTAAGRFAEAAALQRKTEPPVHACGLRNPSRPSECAVIDDCWVAYLEARSGRNAARQRLAALTRTVEREDPESPRGAPPPECLLLAADLAEPGQRIDVLSNWRPPDSADMTPERYAWQRLGRLRALLWLELTAQDSPAVVRELESDPAATVARAGDLAPPFSALHAAALTRLEATEELSQVALKSRAELRLHRAVWLAKVGDVEAAFSAGKSAQEDWDRLEQSRTDDAHVAQPDGFARRWLVVLALRAGKLGQAQELMRSLDTETDERLKHMVEFFRTRDARALSGWAGSPPPFIALREDWEATLQGKHESVEPGVLLWRGPYLPPLPPDQGRAVADSLLTSYVGGGSFSGFSHSNWVDVYEVEQAVRALGAADEYPELARGVKQHRALWSKRDRVLPLLILGSWWGQYTDQ